MDSYSRVPQDIMTAFQGARSCLEKLDDFSNDFLLDAELEVSDIDESHCLHLCLDIKSASVSLEKIQLSLSEIAKNYNNSFVTDYPLFFQMYRDQYLILMTEQTLQMLQEVEKMADVLAADAEKAADAMKAADAEKAASLPPALAQLCQEVGALDALTRNILALCQKTLGKEERLRLNPKKCVGMLQEVIELARRNQQGVIRMCQQSGGSLMMKPQPSDGRPLMSEVMKRYGSLEEFATAQLHHFSMSDVNTYVVEKALMESRLQGLTEEEAEWWGEEPEMARQVRYVIEHLDELGVEGKKQNKDGLRIIDSPYIYMLMKWAHLLDKGCKATVPRFLKYIKGIYRGQLLLPSKSHFHRYKNAYDKEDYLRFTDKLRALLDNREQTAMQISI